MINSLGWKNFSEEVNQADEQINLARASLYFAQTVYDNLDINQYLNRLDIMAAEVKQILPSAAYPLRIIKAINKYLFTDLGFRGNQNNYYDPQNSYLNQVIERQIGIPITLSIIYLEIAKRINFPMVGIGMPGHFIIRPDFEEAGIFVDAFHQGEILFAEDCVERLEKLYQQKIELQSKFLEPVSNKQILGRMLTNLKFIYLEQENLSKTLEIIEGILMIFPQQITEVRDRGIICCNLGKWQQAIQDLERYLLVVPYAKDADNIRQLLQQIKEN